MCAKEKRRKRRERFLSAPIPHTGYRFYWPRKYLHVQTFVVTGAATVPRADIVVRSHSERVAAGRVQSSQFTVSLAPKVTFSEDAVLLSLQRGNTR